MKRSLLFGAIMFGAMSVVGQNQVAPEDPEFCGSNKYRDQLFEIHPSMKVADSVYQAEFQVAYEAYMKSLSNGAERASYIIPVVVHVVHLNGPENISDAQIYDAIRILNEDFAAMNSDISQVVPSFTSVVGNGDVEFRLATKDPNGNCHKGITRTYSNNTYDTGPTWTGHPIVEDVAAQHGTWIQQKYMNVFICIDPDGAAGYTLTPNSGLNNTMYGGILLRHGYMGSIGTGNYQLARALTHEVGHWLNLSHTWGPNNNPGNAASCSDDDGVSDTPNTIGWTSCNTAGNTCNSLDNVQNYMEYSYCSRMFTAGQVARMHTALNDNEGGRNNLHTASNLNATGTANLNPPFCQADFEADIYTICEGESVDFSDLSFHNANNWSWTFTGGTPSTSSDQNPTGIVYSNSGTYSVTLTAGDGTSSDTETKTALITVLPADALSAPVTEGFESITSVPDNNFEVENPENDGTWEITTSAAALGSKSVKITNSSSDAGTIDGLISNTYDLSGFTGITMSFDHAFARRDNNDVDKLSVYVSNDCGKTWSVRKNISGTNLATASNTNSNFVPSASEWETTTITNISASYLVPGFRYKFEFTSDGGNNIYVDNINLSGPLGVPVISEESFNLNVFPNPSNGEVNIAFDMPLERNIKVDVLDVTGRTVAHLMNASVLGSRNLQWNSANVSNGVYMIQLRVGEQIFSRKLIVE